MKSTTLTLVLAGACALSIAAATPTPDPNISPAAKVGLLELRQDFHLAASTGDLDLMRSLWTEDSVFNGGGVTVEGADNIVNFLSSSPLWGASINLTSESKLELDPMGNTAMYAFECIIVRVDGGDPLTTSLSSIPPGSQSANVEIVQHSNTNGIAVREDGRWKFLTFNGSGGPI